MRVMGKASGGFWAFNVVFVADLPSMLAAAGDPDNSHQDLAHRLLQCVDIASEGLTEHPDTLCLLCPREFNEVPAAAFVMMMPHSDEQEGAAVVNFICPFCAEDHVTLAERAFQFYKDHLFGGNATRVPAPMAWGHA